MRAISIGVLTILWAGAPALAQSATEGPLAPPAASGVTSKTTTSTPKKAAHKTAHAHDKPVHAKPTHAKGAGFDAEGRPAAEPILHAPGEAPADPLSFGMKWNGANDDARGTRVQNYDGNAQGTGAEVGMKLHF